MTARAKEPFHFFTRLSLTSMTGIKAKNLQELLESLKTVPETVVYYHTHRFLQQHQYLVPEPPNDFAYWVTNMLQNKKLGERLAAIDTVQFNTLSDLRAAFVRVLEESLKENNNDRQAPPEGEEFHFMQAVRFSLPTPYQAWDLGEFVSCLKKVSISSLYLHIFEARLRPPLGINDFSYWLDNQLAEKELAKKIAGFDPYTQTLEGLRVRIIGFMEQRLKEIPRAAP
ncbi:MAG: hypothetical protein HYT79_02080 [Elusimicrobia bacterium]|nr:hypothetical protein [Elusimicrobiota bacterium]